MLHTLHDTGLRSMRLSLLWIAVLAVGAHDPDTNVRKQIQQYLDANIQLRRQYFKQQCAKGGVGIVFQM